MQLLRPFAALACVACLWAGEAAVIPANVNKDIEDFRARVAKINADADKKRTDETAKFKKVLDEYVKTETRKGNLDQALAIRKLKDELTVPVIVDEGDLLGPPTAAPPAPAVSMATLVVGRWRMQFGGVWTLKPDGVFSRTRGLNPTEVPGTWKVVDGKVIIVYEDGREHAVVRVDQKQIFISIREGAEVRGDREE